MFSKGKNMFFLLGHGAKGAGAEQDEIFGKYINFCF